MATVIINNSSKNVPIDIAFQMMGDAILKGLSCQIWQGMNCLAVWNAR